MIEFAFHVQLTPWAQGLRDHLRLSLDGTAQAAVEQGDPPYNPGIVWKGPAGIKFLFVFWPLDGKNWYPNGLPSDLHWRHPKHINV